MNENQLREMRMLLGFEIAQCIEDVQRVLGFELPPSDQEVFLRFHKLRQRIRSLRFINRCARTAKGGDLV